MLNRAYKLLSIPKNIFRFFIDTITALLKNWLQIENGAFNSLIAVALKIVGYSKNTQNG